MGRTPEGPEVTANGAVVEMPYGVKWSGGQGVLRFAQDDNLIKTIKQVRRRIFFWGAFMYKPRIFAMVGMLLASTLLALPAWAESQARIVRMSEVQGSVQIDKNAGLGFENAFVNLPVTQGTQLRTRENGRAEIEFEDGSTLRITPNTTVQFSRLGLSDAGKRISAVELVEGKAYVNWMGKSGDEFTLNFSGEKVELRQPAHFRVARSSGMTEIASFKNELEVVGPAGATKVGKKKMVTFNVNDNDSATLTKNFEEDPYDQWDKQAIEYHEQYSKNNSTPYGYGSSDLNYYGGYSNVAGYGTLWQPYFTGVGWNPFMDGAWSWYPGMGFMWASAYPWGWTPYYYGNWMFVPGFGWGWQPGGFNTWHGGIHHVGALETGFHPPVAPTGTVSTVVVGRGGPVTTKAPAMGTVVNRGSAGLGLARGAYGNLRQLNTQVAKAGSVQVHAALAFAASSHVGGFGHASVASHPAGSMGHASGGSSGHASGGGHTGH
jgi:FecR protein